MPGYTTHTVRESYGRHLASEIDDVEKPLLARDTYLSVVCSFSPLPCLTIKLIRETNEYRYKPEFIIFLSLNPSDYNYYIKYIK